jgi:pyruvate/2-oxoglutarate dehydrogenase complex dihydrolipoamide dehydrogenase (E3) component
LDISGLEEIRTATAWEVLSGKKRPRGTCLVLGAGLVGCETADYLSDQGREVILVEILPGIATGADADTKAYFTMRFQEKGVMAYTGTEVLRIEGKTAHLRQGREEMQVEINALIFAVGAVPEEMRYEVLTPSGTPIIRVGDCVKPRTILESVQEGFQAGSSI